MVNSATVVHALSSHCT